ncbi:MAG: ABC transporter permease [Candidatus Bathyarchaeota archaeon]|nr:ABC transporter permease [Candidatus Bathyarchaeota archaeon]
MKSNGVRAGKARTGEWEARWADFKYTLYLLRRNPLVLIGSLMAFSFIVLSLLANYIVDPSLAKPTGYPEFGGNYPFMRSYVWSKGHFINWGSGVQLYDGPEFFYLGTDGWGRDLLKMIILALPVDMENAVIITLVAAIFGTLLGTLAGYAGGVIDEAILRVTDIFFAFPALVLALVFAAMFGRSIPTLRLAIILVWWPPYVRLMRGQILIEKEKSYVEALRALGAGYPKTYLVIQERNNVISNKIVALGAGRLRFLLSRFLLIFQRVINSILDQLVLFGMHLRILFRHILPNSIYPILVQATLDFGGVILTFSALMFLGFSPSPSLPELGNLASDGYGHVFDAPWLMVFPGLVMLVIALAFNLVGDGLRDVLDPKLRR